MKIYRLRYRQEVDRLRKLIKNLTFDNSQTRALFEKKFGKKRHVIVMENDRSTGARCSGEVIEFWPFGRVSVIAEDGEVIQVPLELLERDYCDVPSAGRSEAIANEDRRRKLRRIGLALPVEH